MDSAHPKPVCGGNLLLSALMDAPSLTPGWCVLCGKQPVTGHHVVPRAQGGHDGPVLDLCGHGTIGDHGAAEDRRLHFRYRAGWQYLRTDVPTKYTTASLMDGWRSL